MIDLAVEHLQEQRHASSFRHFGDVGQIFRRDLSAGCVIQPMSATAKAYQVRDAPFDSQLDARPDFLFDSGAIFAPVQTILMCAVPVDGSDR
jgi:hypothetical protein